MQRHFNQKQRIALAQAFDWKCAVCNNQLQSGWHSDHIIPFSKGGLTDVLNGQPLCPSCNLKKGTKMVNLREWQQKALTVAIDTYNDPSFIGEGRAFLTHATPGGGKTIHGLSVFDEGRRRRMFAHIIVVCPSTTLVSQWKEDAAALYGIQLKSGMLYNGMPDFHEYHGMIFTYAGMNENPEALRIFTKRNPSLIVADEAHHLSDGASWGESFKTAFTPAAHKLIVTGTPWTSTQSPIPFTRYGDGYVIPDFTYSKKQAIKDRVCRVTEFYPMTAKNLEFIDSSTGEISKYNTLDEAVEAGHPAAYQKTMKSLKHMKALFMVADMQLSAIREMNGRTAGGLIVAPDIRTAHAFQNEIIMLTGVEYTIVHSKAEKAHDKIKEFRDSNERWLISVDMVTEGVDIKRLQCCVFLSRAKTELFLRQVIGRIERIRSDISGDVDLTAYFYYTDFSEINEIVGSIEEENKAGEQLRDQDDEQNNPRPEGSRAQRIETDFLVEVVTENERLISEGLSFSEDVVIEAVKRRKEAQILFDVPMRFICKMVMADNDQNSDRESTRQYEKEIPIDEKKARARKVIQKEIWAKLGQSLGRKPEGRDAAAANNYINAAIGIEKTNGDISMSQLERKLQFIADSEASSWAL